MIEQEKEMLKEENAMAQSAAPARHLLAARAKQIKALREDVAGWEETARLSCAFMMLLSLALTGERQAHEAVEVQRHVDGALSLSISREGLSAALDKWQVQIEKEENAYRIAFHESCDRA